ncbi:MAG: hypothetical protein M3335_11025, partial [Actinomycetota bacterium]|nr:hypothetical protein [Actinomycetota bacterium]
RIYWVDGDGISYASLAGGGGGDVPLTGSVFNGAYGLAFDPALQKLYWANYANEEDRTGAIGYTVLGGAGGGINIATAPVDGPQDPVVVKSPSGAGAPAIARDPEARSKFSCTPGSWGSDFPGSFVYQAPLRIVYQWTRNRKPIPGAIATTFEAGSRGSYACEVTAFNPAGPTVQSSSRLKVKPPRLALRVKGRARAASGRLAVFRVRAKNRGDLKSGKARVCLKLPKAARGELSVKGRRCKPLGRIEARGQKAVKLRVEVDRDAAGSHKVKFRVRGSAGNVAKSRIVIR